MEDTGAVANKEWLTCAICLELFEEPKKLPCKHTFCRKCLKDHLLSHQKINWSCPFCRTSLSKTKPEDKDKIEGVTEEKARQLAEDYVEQLPTNILVAYLVELSHRETNRDTVQSPGCDLCRDYAPAVMACEECCMALCEFHCESHKRTRPTIHHKLVSAEHAGDLQLQDRMRRCSRHNGEILKLFCRDCNVVICQECPFDATYCHFEHKCIRVADAFGSEKSGIIALLGKISADEKEVTQLLAVVRERQKQVEEAAKKVHGDIDTFFDDLAKLMQMRRAELLQENEKVKQRSEKTLMAQEAFLENLLASTKTCGRTVARIAAQETIDSEKEGFELLRMKRFALETSSLLAGMKQMPRPDVRHLNVFVPSTPDIKISTIGSLSSVPIGKLVLSFSAHLPDEEKDERPFGLAINTKEHSVVVSAHMAKEIRTFSIQDGSLLQRFCPGLKAHPVGAAFNSPTCRQLLMAEYGENEGIVEVDMAGGKVARRMFEGNFKGAYAVCVNPKSKDLVVLDRDGNCFIMFDSKQHIMRKKIGQKGNGPSEFNTPESMTICPATGNIIVADSQNERVQVFDREGNFLYKFDCPTVPTTKESKKTPKDEQKCLRCLPSAIAADGKGNLLIGDSRSLSVLVVTKKGHLLTRLWLPRKARMVRAIDVDKQTGQILVIDAGMQVYVFE